MVTEVYDGREDAYYPSQEVWNRVHAEPSIGDWRLQLAVGDKGQLSEPGFEGNLTVIFDKKGLLILESDVDYVVVDNPSENVRVLVDAVQNAVSCFSRANSARRISGRRHPVP
jgi:hypothetical protein